tara:strand:- start:652 stop:1503 length:852 start_codon:yes stop_codon:yes gene_type:complete
MKPQKAMHLYAQLEKKNPKLEGKGFMLFEKYDGWYGYLDTDGTIMSRQMREIPSLKWLSEELKIEAGTPQGRLIFEILVEGSPVFKDLNGILNRHEQASNAYLIVHDFIPTGEEDMAFHMRYNLAQGIVLEYEHPRVRIATPISTIVGANLAYWRSVADSVWEEGGEGIIIKDANAPYSAGKRNSDILKIKLEKTEEMVVTGVHIGQRKYSDTLGYLLVTDVHGALHKASGMTDGERDAWWTNPELIIHQVVEVQFMQRLANGSLREPRFKAVRHDKTVEELG